MSAFVVITLQTGSLFIGLVGTFGVVFAVPVAIFFYCTVFGIIAGIYTIQAKTDTPSYRYALPFRFIK